MKKLIIYYDNPNKYSDMYLKYLEQDLQDTEIQYTIFTNYEIFLKAIEDYKDYDAGNTRLGILPMMPVADNRIMTFLRTNPIWDIDNVGGNSIYNDATAVGIFRHITEVLPDRNNAISVIGRGKVGGVLISLLIDYGYTVYEFNSKSDIDSMYIICGVHSNAIVGLSSQTVFDQDLSEGLAEIKNLLIIDASNTFTGIHTQKCGAWTRKEILSRI